MTAEQSHREAELEREVFKLRKINRALMERVERSMELQGNAFSMSQTAIILEQRVRERTLALERAMESLEDAKSVAEQANLSKTRFLAAASHDLMQPLSAARLFASALVERRMAPANAELTRRVLASLNSVESILSSLLDISRLEAGVLPVSVHDVPLAELFTMLAEEFCIVAVRKGVSLRWLATRVVVRSDPKLLGRILRNYVSNALRYTAPGGRVLIGCRRVAGRILVGVWDTGQGIPEDKLDEIFQEFHRLGDHDGEPGIGLGLTIVQRMAATLGHPLEVRSQLGRGSLFGVVVPVSTHAATPDHLTQQVSRVAAPWVLRDARIVVIDNDSDVLAGLRVLLGNWECQTVGAVSAVEALAEMSDGAWTPNLIIADYQLGNGETGVEAVMAIRARFGAEIPALVISANTSGKMQDDIHRINCQFLAKPLQKGALRSLLAHLLDDRAKGD